MPFPFSIFKIFYGSFNQLSFSRNNDASSLVEEEQEEAVVVVVGSIDVPHEALGRVIYLLISN